MKLSLKVAAVSTAVATVFGALIALALHPLPLAGQPAR